ncbi:hypothetical protein [Streptomyces sp. NPDC058092]
MGFDFDGMVSMTEATGLPLPTARQNVEGMARLTVRMLISG